MLRPRPAIDSQGDFIMLFRQTEFALAHEERHAFRKEYAK